MWVIFIVSCIPSVRPIFVKAFNKVYGSGSRTFATGQGYNQHTDPVKSGTHTHAYAANLNVRNMESKSSSLPTGGDNESEENILLDQKGIMMTSQVVVKYGDNERVEGNRDWRNHFDDTV